MAGLQELLDEFKKGFESGAPPYNAPHETIEKMHRATAELKASGLEASALKVGYPAPSFTLFNQDHVQVASTDLLREGPLVSESQGKAAAAIVFAGSKGVAEP